MSPSEPVWLTAVVLITFWHKSRRYIRLCIKLWSVGPLTCCCIWEWERDILCLNLTGPRARRCHNTKINIKKCSVPTCPRWRRGEGFGESDLFEWNPEADGGAGVESCLRAPLWGQQSYLWILTEACFIHMTEIQGSRRLQVTIAGLLPKGPAGQMNEQRPPLPSC